MFNEKLPHLERILKFKIKRIPQAKHDDILQIARMKLWKRCLKSGPISLKFIIKDTFNEMFYKIENEMKTTLFSTLENSEYRRNDNCFSDMKVFSKSEPLVVLDDTTLTVRDVAIDFLEQYANNQKDRNQIADTLGTSPENIQHLRRKLGKPPVKDYRWCRDSIEQIRSQIEKPVLHRESKNITTLACSDCGKIKTFTPSMLKVVKSEVYRCRKCNNSNKLRCSIHNRYHGPAGCPICKKELNPDKKDGGIRDCENDV